MPRTKFSATDLNQIRHRLDRWRQSQSGATRLPEDLWTSAATLTETASGTNVLTYHYDYRGSTVALTDDALREIDRFFKEDHAVIVPLTVREILDEQIARKLV